jgi:hypothetical protein
MKKNDVIHMLIIGCIGVLELVSKYYESKERKSLIEKEVKKYLDNK